MNSKIVEEKFKLKTILFIATLFLLTGNIMGQTAAEVRRSTRIKKANFNQLMDAVKTIDFHLIPESKRIAVMDFDYSKKDIDDQTAEIIRIHLEQALSNNGYQVVKIPELKSKPVTFIQGKDSSVRISHLKPSTKIKSNGDAMHEVLKKYGIQSFIEGSLVYDINKGYLLYVQLFDSQSRVLLLSKLLVSNTEKNYSSRSRFHIDGGLGNFPNSYFNPRNSISQFKANNNTVNINLTWRQSFNYKNTGYFGYNFGLDILTAGSISDSLNYNLTSYIPYAGVRYYISFLQKKHHELDYLLEYSQGIGFFSSRHYSLFIEQGLNCNLTTNMGIGLHFKYLITPVQVYRPEATFSTGNLNLGINAYYRF